MCNFYHIKSTFSKTCWALFYFKDQREQAKLYPAGIYMFKDNNRNTKTKCGICSKLTIKTPERRTQQKQQMSNIHLWRHLCKMIWSSSLRWDTCLEAVLITQSTVKTTPRENLVTLFIAILCHVPSCSYREVYILPAIQQ